MNVAIRPRSLGRLLLVALAALLLGAKTPLELDGTSWHFPSVLEQGSAKAGKFKEKGKDLVSFDLVLPGAQTMEVWVDGDNVAQGSYTRKSVTSHKLVGELDAQSLHDMALEVSSTLEKDLAMMGYDATVDLEVVHYVLSFKLKTKVKQDQAWLKAKVKFQFKGTVSVLGETYKLKAKQTLKGLSDPLSLSELMLHEL